MNCSYLLCFVLFGLFLDVVRCSIYICDFEMDRMIELTARRPFCRLHTDRGGIISIIVTMQTDALKVRQVPKESIKALEQVCFESGTLTGELEGGLSFIYPGTKYCGPGNIAKNYSDIGRYAEEDKCCRAHDYCSEQLLPGQCKRSICNTGSVTRSHCDCDEKFRKCLQGLNTEVANTLGAAFFNVVQVTCFSERRPCTKWQRNEIGEECEYAFRPSSQYLFARNNNLFQPTANRRISARSDTGVNTADSGLLRLQSLGIIIQNLMKDVVVRPLRGLKNFLFVTKNIYFNPQKPIRYNQEESPFK